MSPLRILILSDGRPGHFNLSEGIAVALGRDRETAVSRLTVRRGRWPGAMLAAMTTSHLPAQHLLAGVYGVEAGTIPESDIIVSAGAETLAANIWAARLLGIPNIYYGSLRLFDPQDFSLVLTSYRRNAGRPRHALALKPAPFDPDVLRQGRLGQAAAPTWPPRRLALVVGGDAPGFAYAASDWRDLLAGVRKLRDALGVEVIAANSRRTPDVANRQLTDAAADPTSGIAEFLDVHRAGPGTLTPAIAACDLALCTADSSSMISECVWLGLPTITLTLANATLERNEADYRQWLESQRWTATLPLGDLRPSALEAAASGVMPMRANPLTALAALLRKRLPALPENRP